jgi:hypothetical protein
LLRSEAEKLVRHELIKNLGKFKQMVAALLSPWQNSSSEKKSVVLCLWALEVSVSIERSKTSLKRQPSRWSGIC